MSYRSLLHHPFDPSDPLDGFWDSLAGLLPPQLNPQKTASNQSLTSVNPAPTPVVLPAETYQAQAAVSASGSGGAGSVVAETSGGLTINLVFDAAAMSAPASFRAGIEQAAALLSAAVSDKITLNFQIDYSGTGGGAAAGPDNGQWLNYTTVRSDLLSNASPGDTSFNALPAGSSIQGQSSVAVWNAQLKLWGLLGANDTTTDDGSATFATDIDPNLLVGVALHELTHAMGRVPYGPEPDIFDFYRFTSSGGRLFTDNIPANAAYFSLDGGNTKIADYGQSSDPSDFLNSGVQGANDAFDEYYGGGTLQQLTSIDLKQLDALGFHLISQTPLVIQTDGTTSLVKIGSAYFIDAVGSGTGPQLLYNGSPVTTDESGGWSPIGAIQTSGGYDVAWKMAGADQYLIWSVDKNGNYVSNLTPIVSGNSLTLENFETTFHQDLNGDGTVGVTNVVIQMDGSTSLTEIANDFYLYNNGVGPSLKAAGQPVIAGETGGWSPIGAIQTSGGYDVAWKMAAADQYLIWSTDKNGNYVSNLTAVVSGTSFTLENFETTFHQDLNGDATIGVTNVVIQVDGSTALTELANNFYLYNNGVGPSLKVAGQPVIAGEIAGWNPIGAIQTSGGYDVAWKMAGADQYLVWSVDKNGNYVSNLIPIVSGSSLTLESFETTFHQDLNGDRTIGVTNVVIQVDGSTSLTEIANNFYLYNNGVGPSLKAAGQPVIVGETGGWSPIGAIQTSGGYDVAWKMAAADQYLMWSTDKNGNYVSNLTAVVSGTSFTLENFETTFHQDLNGDGTIGVPASTSPGAAEVTQAVQTSFDGQTLTLDTPSAFSGQLIGFTGDGALAASDQVDFRGLKFNTLHSSFDPASGTLSLNSGTNTTSLRFLGRYSQDSFHFADDGNGGTLVVAGTAVAQAALATEASSFEAHDTFVFAANFGNVILPSFTPATDTLQFSKPVFASLTSLLAATHDDGSSNAVITDAAHDTITLQHVTTAQLIAHQSDFHFV